MSIFRWRDRAIFRVSEAPLDPDEIRLRVRRRLLKFCCLFGLVVLSIPVLRHKQQVFHTDRELSRLAGVLIDARMRAAMIRAPVGVELGADGVWQVYDYAGAESCESHGVEDRALNSTFRAADIQWRLLHLDTTDSSGLGVDVGGVCFHPVLGVLVDSKPLENGWLYILAAPVVGGGKNSVELGILRQLVLTKSGSEIAFGKVN